MNCISPSRRRKRTARNKRRLSCQKEEEADASSSLFLWFRASGASSFCRRAKGRFPPPIFFSIVPGGDISSPRGRGTFGAAPARGTFPPPIFFSSCRKENPPEGLLLPLRGNSPPGPRPVQKKRTLFPDEPGKSWPIQPGFQRLSPLSWQNGSLSALPASLRAGAVETWVSPTAAPGAVGGEKRLRHPPRQGLAKRKARKGAQRQDDAHAPEQEACTLLYINGVLRGRCP